MTATHPSRSNPLDALRRFVRHTSVPDVFLTLSQRLFLSVVVLCLVIATSWVNPWPVTLVAGGLTLVAIRAYAKGQELRLLRRRKLILGIAGFLVWLVIYMQFRTVIGQNAGIAAITMLVALKLFEMDRRRDGLILLFLAQVMVMGLFFVSQEIIAAVCALGMELMLFTGQRALFQSPHATWQMPWRGVRQSARLLGLALILGALLFVVFPRPSEPIWNIGLPQTSSSTGLSETMSPGSLDSLVRSGNIAFSVTMHTPMPPANKRYWRGPSMTNYRDGQWSITRANVLGGLRINEPALQRYEAAQGIKAWRYTLFIEPSFRNWVYTLEKTLSVSPKGIKQVDGLWLSEDVIGQQQVFEVTSLDLPNEDEPDLDMRQSLLRFVREANFTEPRLRVLAEQWRNEALKESGEVPLPNDERLFRYPAPLPPKSAKAVVAKALQYFRQQNFVYALDNVKLADSNPMDDFLFDKRRGFCEAYAGAFTLLMRVAGIPARVVTGYQGGEYNNISGQWVIRQSDAHAWNEVWIEDEGWLRVDPTAAIAPDRIEHSLSASLQNAGALGLLAQSNNVSWLRQSLLLWEGTKTKWNQWVVLYSNDSQNALLSGLSLGWFTRYHLAGVVIFLVIGFITVVYWRNRARQVPLSPENQWWHAIIRQLQQRQFQVDTTMPPNEVLQQVQHADAAHNKERSALSRKLFTTHVQHLQSFVETLMQIKYQRLSPEVKAKRLHTLKALRKKI